MSSLPYARHQECNEHSHQLCSKTHGPCSCEVKTSGKTGIVQTTTHKRRPQVISHLCMMSSCLLSFSKATNLLPKREKRQQNASCIPNNQEVTHHPQLRAAEPTPSPCPPDFIRTFSCLVSRCSCSKLCVTGDQEV